MMYVNDALCREWYAHSVAPKKENTIRHKSMFEMNVFQLERRKQISVDV